MWNIFHKYKVFLWNRYHSKQIVLENEAEAKAKVKVEVEAEVEVENSPYKTYKNIEDKVASKMNQILCKQSGRAECTQIFQ